MILGIFVGIVTICLVAVLGVVGFTALGVAGIVESCEDVGRPCRAHRECLGVDSHDALFAQLVAATSRLSADFRMFCRATLLNHAPVNGRLVAVPGDLHCPQSDP